MERETRTPWKPIRGPWTVLYGPSPTGARPNAKERDRAAVRL